MKLVSELRRRSVFRMAVLYLGAAWLILQVVDLLIDRGPLPESLGPLTLTVLVIGFPIALALSWFYEVTPEGVVRDDDFRLVTSAPVSGRRLDFVIIAVLAAAVLLFAYDKWWTAPPPERSVAVLPFVAMSSGEDDGYFADGLTDEILNALEQLPELQVSARTSSFFFKGKEVPVPEIADLLKVAHIVEGSVRQARGQVRINVQLVRAADGFSLWSNSYDRSREDILGVQSEIAEKIATALGVVLDEEQLRKMQSVGMSNPEAFVAFQKALELYGLAHDEAQGELLVEANDWFERAIELSPGFSRAYVLHADYFMHLLADRDIGKAIPDDEAVAAMQQIQEDIENAIRYAPDESSRLFASYDRALLTGEWRGLKAMVGEIVKQHSCRGPIWLEVSTLAYGEAREYLTTQQELISCDPLNAEGWFNAALSHLWLGEHEAAIELIRKGLDVTSSDSLRNLMVRAHIASGQIDQAEVIIARDIRNERGAIWRLAMAAAARGDAPMTKALINDFVAAWGGRGTELIQLRAMAGERDLANELAAELDSRPYGYLTLMLVPYRCMCGAPFDLAATPKFAELISDAALPWPPASPMNWPLKDW